MHEEQSRIEDISSYLHGLIGEAPQVAVVLGSGWADRAEGLLENLQRLPIRDIPHWPMPKVQGHNPELRVGDLGNRKVILCGGRVHSYEGWSARELVRGVRGLVSLGVKNVLLLNAAGSLHEERLPGQLMPLSDHINLGLPNPLGAAESADGGTTFLDLVDIYNPIWRANILQRCPELRPGVYAALPGPSYETPAEVRRLQQMGADAVGMSTVPEALAAHAAGARVMAISMMTNYAAGIGGSRPSHEEVLETAKDHSKHAAEVLAAAVESTPC